ncbi:MAG: F0F1 ATP synthase subunit epsilon [Gammaproteobacteria bacterium]|nr:F0F1 ATP synthase subunit epsilon [Gammaproteobacteria bacterium]
MRLLVTTPVSVVIDAQPVLQVTAEDETGSFAVRPGHADFITVLGISVLSWRDSARAEHHVAVRGGILSVRDGELVEIATREAVGEDTLTRLGEQVLERFRREAVAESRARHSTTRLQLAAIRQLQRYLDASRRHLPPAAPGEGEHG